MLPASLMPFFASFFLTGGLLAFPGAVLDHLLADFGWSPSRFGVALLVQGVAAFLGTRLFSKATERHELHGLEALGLLLPVVGIVVVYLLDATPLWPRAEWGPVPTLARFVGYAFLGAGIGGSGIVNNAYALRQDDAPRALNVLNMGFTLGAVTLPALSTAILALAGDVRPSLGGVSAWRLPVGVFLLLFVALAAWFRAQAKAGALPVAPQAPQAPAAPATCAASTAVATSPSEPVSPRDHALAVPSAAAVSDGLGWGAYGVRPLVCACVILFAYVGTEINLSNSWVAFVQGSLGVDAGKARLASPVYWGGLFAARLYFALRSPRAETLPRYLTVFGFTVLACVAGAMALARATGGEAGAVGATAALALAFLSGAFIGSSYSFALGALTHFYSGVRANRAAFATAQSGVAGSVILPPALGAALDAGGPMGGFAFVSATLCVFCAACVTLLATRARATLHST